MQCSINYKAFLPAVSSCSLAAGLSSRFYYPQPVDRKQRLREIEVPLTTEYVVHRASNPGSLLLNTYKCSTSHTDSRSILRVLILET